MGGSRAPAVRPAGSIAQKVSVPINGVHLGMVIRGRDAANPVLLWVHGGPGMPDYPLTGRYPPDLEDRIHLLGHSWGSLIAVLAAARSPERYRAYLGMAQMVHQLESERIAYDYLLAACRERGETGLVRRLESAPVTMADGTPEAYLRVRDTAMHRLGVGTTHDMRSVITGIFLASWRFHGYTLAEKVDLWRGRAFSTKGFYVFDHSAHSPLLEEPHAGRRILEHDVLNGATDLAELRS